MKRDATNPRSLFGVGTTLTGTVAPTRKLLDDLVEVRLARIGLTIGEADVLTLVLISAPDHPPPTQLAEWLSLTTAGITGRLNTLERKGIIERKPHATDGRRVDIHLTTAGSTLAGEVMTAKNEAWSQPVIDALGAAEAARLNATLEELNKALRHVSDRTRIPATT